MTTPLEQLVDPAALVAAVEGGEQLQVRAPAQVGIEVRRLDKAGDAVECLGQLVLRVASEQARSPGIRAEQAEQDCIAVVLPAPFGPRKP